MKSKPKPRFWLARSIHQYAILIGPKPTGRDYHRDYGWLGGPEFEAVYWMCSDTFEALFPHLKMPARKGLKEIKVEISIKRGEKQ